MKKALRILVITLGVILLLLIVTPLLFRSKIESVVKRKINDQVHATVDWSRFSLSFFRGFPYLSINMHQVSVVGTEPFAGDTLAGIQRFELKVNPFSALSKNIIVKSILLESPLISGMVMEDGTANWDITNESSPEQEEVSDESSTDLTISLKQLSVTGGRIYYLDLASEMDASMEGFNLELRGDFSREQSELKVTAGIDRVNAKMGGVRYLREGVITMDLLAAADMSENMYTLKETLITLNGLTLGAEGQVAMLEGGAMEMDLKFFSRETSFQTLLSLIPTIYLQDFESLKTSGSLQLDGAVTGIMKDSIFPDANLHLLVKDGYFAYPGLPKDVSDVQVSLHADYRGTDMDSSRVELEQFHMLLGGNPFDLSMQVDHPASDMHVAGRARGTIDFGSLKDIVPMEGTRLDGKLEADLRWDTRLSFIEKELYENVDMEGSLSIQGMVVETPEIAVPVMLDQMNLLFNPRTVKLTTLDMKLGLSDLHMDGDLENFIPYVFDGQTLSGQLNVSSSLLDANELIPEEEETMEPHPMVIDTLVPVQPDSLAEPVTLRIPENIDFALNLDMKRVEYLKITVRNMEGKMRVMKGVAGLEQLKMEIIGGSLNASGWVDTRGEFAETDVSVQMRNVDIPSAYETFVSLEKLAPMVRYCRGKADISMDYHSLLDNSFAPLYESIEARGQANTAGLQFFDLDDFIPMSEVLKNEKFNEMAPGEVQVGFTVRDGRVIFNPFTMAVYHSKMVVSGSHGIDLTMDYTFDMMIAKKDLGAGANQMMQGMAALAAGAGLNVPQSDYVKVIASIRGTFNQPKITTDLSGNLKSAGETVQAVVVEKITEEVERAEEQVRDHASAEAEKIIRSAEEEAARLVEEARKQGEQLVKEAEIQGEKLMKEAGSNPLKQVAAKKASGELKRQAEKQSENLVNEAEVKAAEIIQKARDEAEKI